MRKKGLVGIVILSVILGGVVGWLILKFFWFGKNSSSESSVTPTPSKTVKVIIPTVTPHNTPTPGNPRLESPTEDYQKQLLENQKSQGLVVVKIGRDGFEPARVYLKKGGVVTWMNEDEKDHQVVGDSGTWGSKRVLGKSQGFSQQFDVPGSYPYHCALHPDEKGEVLVSE